MKKLLFLFLFIFTSSLFIYSPAHAEVKETIQVEEIDASTVEDFLYKETSEIIDVPIVLSDGQRFRATRRGKLTEQQKKIYDRLSPEIEKIAAGTKTSTIIEVDAASYGYDSTPVQDYRTVVGALLKDYPFHFYWFGNSYGISTSNYTDGTWKNTLRFYVSAEFSATGASKTTKTDPEKTKAPSRAAEAAADIITSASNKSDYEKLLFYKNTICNLTDYNNAAADSISSENFVYGNPWQLVYVFDGDNDTKVVCEGYAKAFKFLCDLSTFNSERIQCHLADGQYSRGTTSGAHMWNVVRMNNQKNYLVDVTHCDSGWARFLIGATDGSYANGYFFGSANYQYSDETKQSFKEFELTISNSNYTVTADTPCNHEYNTKHPAKAATCEENGNPLYWECDECGLRFGDASCTTQVSSESTVIPKTGHNWDSGSITQEATCGQDGVKTFTCKNDSSHTKTEVIPKTNNHTPYVAEAAVPVTCITNGKTEKIICSVCGTVLQESEKIPATGHNWVLDEHAEPTCTERGFDRYTCSYCSRPKTDYVDALGHDWNSILTVDVEPTCTEEGNKSAHCARCDARRYITAIPAKGHFWNDEYSVDKAPTCLTPGIKSFHCIRCKEKKDPVEIPAWGHDWDEGTVITPPTCTSEGEMLFTCTNDHSHTKTEPINALGHKFDDWQEVTSPNCTDKGSRKRECTVCGFTETEDISANGHAWDEDYTIDVAPTCEEQGSKSIHCSVCGVVKDSEVIAPLGHAYGQWQTTTPASCTAKGQKARTCSRCQKTEQEEIPMTEHAFGDWEVTKEATCNATGTAQRYCSKCNKKESKTINALGHNYDDWEIITSPTCTKEGLKKRTCSRCSNFEEKRLAARGHDWETSTVPATCTQNGSTVKKCSRCDETITTVIPKIGHNLKLSSIKKADLSHEGYLLYSCANCNHTTRTTISKLSLKASASKSRFSVKKKTVKKKKVTVKKPVKVSGAPSAITYKKIKGKSAFKVSASTGNITVKKKTKPGKYKVVIRVTTASTNKYASCYKDVTVNIRIK